MELPPIDFDQKIFDFNQEKHKRMFHKYPDQIVDEGRSLTYGEMIEILSERRKEPLLCIDYKGKTSHYWIYHNHPLQVNPIANQIVEDYLFKMANMPELVGTQGVIVLEGRYKGEKDEKPFSIIYHYYAKEKKETKTV